MGAVVGLSVTREILRVLLARVLGAFAKLRKVTVNFVMSVLISLSFHPSLRMEQCNSTWSHLMTFDVWVFSKISRGNLIFIKI